MLEGNPQSVLEGKMGEPRQRPLFPIQKGIHGKPTAINNVETWANIPILFRMGAAEFAKIGAPGNSGTKVFSLVGKIRNTGLVEVPSWRLGLYTYYERLAQGLRQFMAGSRKFALEFIARGDIAALTREAADISGIDYIMDVDKGKAEKDLYMCEPFLYCCWLTLSLLRRPQP